MNEQQLAEIEARANQVTGLERPFHLAGYAKQLGQDVPALIAEVRRLQAELRPHIEDPGGYLAVGGIVTSTREECAQVCDQLAKTSGAAAGPLACAEAIRKLNKTI